MGHTVPRLRPVISPSGTTSQNLRATFTFSAAAIRRSTVQVTPIGNVAPPESASPGTNGPIENGRPAARPLFSYPSARMPLSLFNSLTRRTEPFVPQNPAAVTFYTCGPTVYDDAHIGNFRSFLAADLLRRFIESPLCQLSTALGIHTGPRRVTHVMNITDVGHMTDDAEGGEAGEDRMAVAGRRLEEAKKSGKLPAGTTINPGDPYQIARFYEDRFRTDARALGLKLAIEAQTDPTLMPRATENVPGMIAVTARLLERGYAYQAGDPGSRAVYFDVQKFAPYGRLSGNTLDKLREGQGGRISAANQSAKRHPADFLLWKEDASHIMKWESPWGWGYPGWHIECTVMSVARLAGLDHADGLHAFVAPSGQSIIDLHSGGEDNIFPHHECEVAQSCCAFNAEPDSGSFASMWFHPRFLLVEGTKMSKSKGNFFTARDLFDKGIEPAALRLALIGTHYRSNADFTMHGLKSAQRTIDRWRNFRKNALESAAGGITVDRSVLDRFAEAMHNDLNISEAIAAVHQWVGEAGNGCHQDADTFDTIDSVLGLFGLGQPATLKLDSTVENLLAERKAARAAKDFKASDAIRDRLAALGFAVKDRPDGTVDVSQLR